MKRFVDLSDAEVLALSDADFSRWIDVECAYEGAPLLPPAPVPPEKPAADADLTVFQVGSIVFRSAEDAAAVVAAMNARPRWDLQYLGAPRYEKKAVPAQDTVEVQPVTVFSPERWEACKDELNAFTQRKALYDADLAEYRKASESRERISEGMIARRERVWDEDRIKMRMRDKFSRYLDLAGGDREIAKRFLAAAHPDAQTVLPELWVVEDMAAEPVIDFKHDPRRES